MPMGSSAGVLSLEKLQQNNNRFAKMSVTVDPNRSKGARRSPIINLIRAVQQ